MRILVLGGSGFLAAEVTAQALARGHDVTCLADHTGAEPPPPGATLVRVDRNHGAGAYAELSGEWEAVVDAAEQPRQVREALASLAPRSAHWTYVSSCSVYADQVTPGQDERAPLLPPLAAEHDGVGPGEREGVGHFGEHGVGLRGAEYDGSAHRTAELACAEALGDRLHVTRPGLLGGPGDRSDRFGYWPARFARDNKPVLLPNIADAITATLDVRDLAAWILDAGERSVTGTFNALGPQIRFGQLIQHCQELTGSAAPTIWADPAWLRENGVAHWAGEHSLPLWLPPDYAGFSARLAHAALSRGLVLRPVLETLADTLEDERRRGIGRDRAAGLSAVTEQLLIERWQRQLAQGPERDSFDFEA